MINLQYINLMLQNVIVKDEFETLHERINENREFYKLKVIHGGVYYQVQNLIMNNTPFAVPNPTIMIGFTIYTLLFLCFLVNL